MRSVHNVNSLRAYVAASMALEFQSRNRSAGHKESNVDVVLMMTTVIQSPLIIIIDDRGRTSQRWI